MGVVFSRIIITKNKFGYRLERLPIRFKSYNRKEKNYWLSYNDRLQNSIIRSRRMVYEYAINNDFKYFVTLTFNDSFDDYNLDMVRNRVQQIIRNMRKKYKKDFQFLLIPERHKKGDWHLHGFFTSDFVCDMDYNSFNYLHWLSFDNFGFSSIEEIRDYESCCKYITKYISKQFVNGKKKSHLYFCSKGLKTSEVLYDLVCTNTDIDYDFYSDYVSIKDFKEDSKLDIFEKIESSFYNYYNSVTDIDNI